MEMPIVDLSSSTQIDWNEPQPFGTYRCDRGWETEGYQCGCLERATTDVGSEYLCTGHALIAILSSMSDTHLADISRSLMVLAWRAKPWWTRAWFLVRNLWRHKR